MCGQFRTVGIVLLLVVFLSCMGGNGKWGRIKPDANITSSFEKFQINADMEYYISGGDEYPTSILGLNKQYLLDTDLWKKVEMKPEIFSHLVTNMRTRARASGGQSQHGFSVLDDEGRPIGIWYSLISGNIVVNIKEDNKVVIHPPRDTENYKQYEGRSGRSGAR
jgi:hypothetical protein